MAVYERQENAVPFQYGISFKEGVQAPADDRIVLDYEDLYISTLTPKDATLYFKAYTGMIVTVFEQDGTPTVLVLKDAEPYTPGTIKNVNAENYKNYWFAPQSTENQSILNELNELNTSVVRALGNLNTSVINLNSSVNEAIDSLNTSVDEAFGNLNSSVEGAIDGINTSVNEAIDSLNTSVVEAIGDINDYVGAIDSSVSEALDNLDTSISKFINDRIGEIISGDVTVNTKFDGGDADDNFKMINKHGSLEKKTIGQLEEMTISEILKAILFEVVPPSPVQNESITISWKGSTYSSTKLVDVSIDFPTVDNDLQVQYKPAKYNWVSSEGARGQYDVSLNVLSKATWKCNTSSNSTTTGNIITDWSGMKANYGTNGYFFVSLDLAPGNYPVDSTNSSINPETGQPYVVPYARTDVKSTTTLSFPASYRVYSNATNYESVEDTALANRNGDNKPIETYKGADDKSTITNLLSLSNTTYIYLQWPGITESEKNTKPCYLYVPTNYKVSSCLGAHPLSGKFEVTGFSFVEQTGTENITNSYGAVVPCKKWKISWEGTKGIVTLKIGIQKK